MVRKCIQTMIKNNLWGENEAQKTPLFIKIAFFPRRITISFNLSSVLSCAPLRKQYALPSLILLPQCQPDTSEFHRSEKFLQMLTVSPNKCSAIFSNSHFTKHLQPLPQFSQFPDTSLRFLPCPVDFMTDEQYLVHYISKIHPAGPFLS